MHGTAQVGKAPVVVDELRRMVDALPGSTLGVRDRALLLLGFAGAAAADVPERVIAQQTGHKSMAVLRPAAVLADTTAQTSPVPVPPRRAQYVYQPDQRVRIAPTMSRPWSAVAYLSRTLADGRS